MDGRMEPTGTYLRRLCAGRQHAGTQHQTKQTIAEQNMNTTKRIIPCLDIENGRVVKGVNFIDIRDAGDPVEIARSYSEQGADELTFLDISATTEGRATTLELVKQVAAVIDIPLTVGGGVREVEDVARLLAA